MRRLVTFKGLEGELDMLQSMIEEAIFNSSDLSLKQEVLLEGLGRLERRVEEEFNGLYLDQIRQLMFKVRMFGMHFASLDIRQDARVVKKAFLALLEAQSGAAAVTAFESMSEAEALDFLFAYDQPHNGNLEEDRHQDVLDSLRAMQEIQRHNGEAGCHRFILSNCAGALDIAILHAMVKASGWEGPMTLDLVPLFESIQDLDGAKAEMAKLYTHPVYEPSPSGHTRRRPNRHARFFGRHQGRRLPPGQLGDLPGQAKPDRHQPRTRTHGDVLRRSRWPPARGGGNTHRFYASLGRDIENREIQTTIQGQTISSNFGIPKSAGFNLELLFTAGVKNRLFDEEETQISEADAALLDELGETSHAHYLALRNRPEFTEFLATLWHRFLGIFVK